MISTKLNLNNTVTYPGVPHFRPGWTSREKNRAAAEPGAVSGKEPGRDLKPRPVSDTKFFPAQTTAKYLQNAKFQCYFLILPDCTACVIRLNEKPKFRRLASDSRASFWRC